MPEETQSLRPHFEEVQAHYDLSDDFFALFLDPTRHTNCPYFERDDMTLEQAQIAKIDLALGKLGLQPGMMLLDVGCGWGPAMLRALEKYDVNVVGPTLSKNQAAYVEQLLAASDSPRSKRVLLAGWEQFHEPVDRIVAIGPLEHFGSDRYAAFFKRAYDLLPVGGTMLLHTIVLLSRQELIERNLPITMRSAFFRLILDEIFPGGRVPTVARVEEHATKVGFTVSRIPPAAAALREDARHVGGGAGGSSGRGDRDRVGRGLRPVHEVPDRLCRIVPRRLHRFVPVHTGKGIVRPAAFTVIRYRASRPSYVVSFETRNAIRLVVSWALNRESKHRIHSALGSSFSVRAGWSLVRASQNCMVMSCSPDG